MTASPSPQELLARLVTQEEHIAILRYAQDHNLESDSEVYFLVGMLKIFAFVFDRMEKKVEAAERTHIEFEQIVSEGLSHFEQLLGEEREVLHRSFAHAQQMLGTMAHQFSATAGEMRALREQIEKATADAETAVLALKAIRSAEHGKALSKIFNDQLIKVLSHSVSRELYDVREDVRDAFEYYFKTICRCVSLSMVVTAGALLATVLALYVLHLLR